MTNHTHTADLDAQVQTLTEQARALKEQKQRKLREEAAAEKEARRQALEQTIKEIVESQDYRFVRTQNAYFVRGPNGYQCLPKQAIQNSHAEIQTAEGFRIFTQILEAGKRIHQDVTASFNHVSDDVLNLVDRRGWIQPKAGEVHPLFDCLLWSLAGESEEAREHIEHVIGWKYLHPEEFTLPCLVFYPEGGIGKNVLVDNVLATLFGAGQVVSVDTEKVSGAFNGMVVGKTVVFIDESQNDKLDMEKMKRLVGNRYIVINEKFQRPYQIENTALYLVGGNDPRGVIRVGHDHSDRRWSVIKVTRPLVTIIAERRGISHEDAKRWLSDNIWVTRDPEQVGRWLYHILSCHRDRGVPQPYHGADFVELASNQRPAWELVAEQVFGDEGFGYISAPALHELVAVFTRQFFPNSRVPNIADLKVYIGSWLAKRPQLGVKPEQRKINLADPGTGKTISSAVAWVKGDANSCVRTDTKAKWANLSGWIADENRLTAEVESVEDKLKRLRNRGLSLVS